MHVVVVGAGVFGTWTALWLARRGATATLVDQYGAGNSLASSGDETRVTRSAHGPDHHYPRWQRHSLGQWRDLEAESGEQLFVPTGVAWFAHRDDGFEASSLQTLAGLGIPSERLTTSAAASRWPQIASDDLGWVLHEPEGGALMARRGVAAAARAAADQGVEVEVGRAVQPDPDDADLLGHLPLADGRRLDADTFVFACGPWLATLFGSTLPLELEVSRQEVVYFATPPGDPRFDAGAAPTWVDYDRAYYGLPSIERRGFKVAPDWPGPIVDPDRQERRLSDERVDAARAYLRLRFPALAAQPVSEGRVCQYETTPDTHFTIDRHPAWQNVWIVGGGSGHGFKHGPALGEYVSALVVGDGQAAAALAPPDRRFALGERRRGLGMRTAGADRDAG